MIASFSRALTEGLKRSMSDAEFDAALGELDRRDLGATCRRTRSRPNRRQRPLRLARRSGRRSGSIELFCIVFYKIKMDNYFDFLEYPPTMVAAALTGHVRSLAP